MSLKEIFCQDKAVAILQRAFATGKWPHAYIFAGAEGVGKFKTAREWSKLLLCEKPVTTNGYADSCGACKSCLALEADSHPDFNHLYKELREFTRDGKGKPAPVDLPVDVVREFLVDKVSIKPSLSQRKVFVVSEAEKLNASSQNCLLKVLEEPPEYCCIILLCTRPEQLLPTTRSRCQIIRFGPIDQDRIIEKLKQMDIEQTNAQYFARLACGSLGRACQWGRLELAEANIYETKKKLINSLSSLRYTEALDLAQQFLDESKAIAAVWAKTEKATSKTDINRRAIKTVLQIVVSALQDAMKLSIAPAEKIINFDQQPQIEAIADRLGPEQAAEKIADCFTTGRWLDASVNERLIFEQLLLNLAVSDKMTV